MTLGFIQPTTFVALGEQMRIPSINIYQNPVKERHTELLDGGLSVYGVGFEPTSLAHGVRFTV